MNCCKDIKKVHEMNSLDIDIDGEQESFIDKKSDEEEHEKFLPRGMNELDTHSYTELGYRENNYYKKNKCASKTYKSIVMALLIMQLIVFATLAIFGLSVYTNVTTIIPPAEKIIYQINSSLPDITMMVDHAPEIVKIIWQINHSLPEIVHIINGLNGDIPGIGIIVNNLTTTDNIAKFQKVLDKHVQIVDIIDTIEQNIPKINAIIDTIQKFNTKNNTDNIQELIDDIPKIMKVVDFIYNHLSQLSFIILKNNTFNALE